MNENVLLPVAADEAPSEGVPGAKTAPFALTVGGGTDSVRRAPTALRDLLSRLSAVGVPCAWVGQENTEDLRRALTEAGLSDAAGVVVGTDEVGRGLPAPDLFLEAARRLGFEPWRCIALVWECDAAAAARRAACQTLGVGPGEGPNTLTATDKTVESLKGLSAARLESAFFSPARTLYADVAVAVPVRRAYTYRVPAALRPALRVGSVVRVPVRGRTAQGVICRLSLYTHLPKARLKPLDAILTPEYTISPDLMALGQWMDEYYLGGPGETLGCIAFFGLHDVTEKTERRLSLADPALWQDLRVTDRGETEAPDRPILTQRQRLLVRFFLDEHNEPITRAELMRAEGCSASVIESLLAKGVLAERLASVDRTDAYPASSAAAQPHALNPEQEKAFAAIRQAVDEHRFAPFLLRGITGSGKTEIYLQTIGRVLKLGRQAIVLVPEISLTPQAVERFRARFGPQVGVYHSQLTPGQKYDLWRRIGAGVVRILVGARSAVFAPFADLGLIVVDEEHEHSYKQSDPAPRYHARDVALWRGRFARCPVILGSATPSLESYWNARQGKFALLELTERVGGARLPEVQLVDMGAQVREERRTELISVPLREAIARRLERREQVILFLNRRGFSNFLLCMACKAVIRCAHCDVVMTWHKVIGKLMCHMCGDTQPRPAVCPACGAPDPAPLGAGTQRIEEEVANLFPQARLLRIDFDTTRGRHGFLGMWEQIEAGEADILLGTQMIAKGLHLERVTLVGVISADHALFLPDFRAAERAFAQLTQVAGRSGRMERSGEVLVQTYVPHHYAIQRAVAHDSEGFYAHELHIRELLRFPPHARLLLTRLSGKNADRVEACAKRLGRALRDRLARNNAYRPLSILGPVPAPIARIQDRARWQVVVRGQAPSLMRRLLVEALAEYEKAPGRTGVTLTLDMDPMDLL